MNTNLSKLEKRLQNLIEDTLSPHPHQSEFSLNLSKQLTEAMLSYSQGNENGQSLPLLVTFIMHPEIASNWQADEPLLQKITNIVRVVCEEQGFSPATDPAISISANSELAADAIQVLVSQRVQTIAETQNIPSSEDSISEVPENAFLIIDGSKVISLYEPVINIGRRNDNHVIIDDPRISRYHAQLRVIHDKYVIFDLNSTGGTFVNGGRITQSALYAGDVISLSGLPIIFGQDNPPENPYLSDTMPLPHTPGEQPTIVLDDKNNFLDKE